MRGDLLFYTPKDWIGWIVAKFTGGPFCHVAIDLGDGTKIEADWNGVVRVAYSERVPAGRYHTSAQATTLDEGIAWLQAQQGDPYGKEDILNQVLRLMGFKFYLGEPKHYDCSDLAAQFLVHAGLGWRLLWFREKLHMITPNDLANVLGVKLGGK